MRRKIVVVDCETDPFLAYRVPRPFVWGYFDGDTYRQFPPTPRKDYTKITDEFVSFLSEQPAVCYAHNGGKFDWHFLLPYVNPYDEMMIINGRIARMMIGLCECRDSFNILPVPLGAYKKDQIDYGLMEESERMKVRNWRKISDYLKSDCVYLWELVTKFITTYGLQLTQAGAAMHQWKKVSNTPLPRTDERFHDLFYPYYYGGRVECFRSGIINGYYGVYDINSAYPYAMLHKHPYSKEYHHADSYVPHADFYKVRCVSAGAFPFRGVGGESDKNFGLHFPDDKVEREYTVTGWEYRAAVNTASIKNVKVLESYTFTEHVTFKDYVNHFYALRLEAKRRGDDAQSLFAKLLMNSLYGKFASDPATYRNHMVVPMDVIAGLAKLGWTFAGEFGPWALAEGPLTDEQKRYYNVATAASITGFVRAMLWEAVATSRDVLYCDTDSMVCRKIGAGVTLGENLGEWKHEGQYDRIGIGGKKLYVFRSRPDANGKRHYKTASKGARLTVPDLWKIARGGSVDFVPDVPTFSPRKAPVFTVRHIKNTA